MLYNPEESGENNEQLVHYHVRQSVICPESRLTSNYLTRRGLEQIWRKIISASFGMRGT
jgi:hypothetical protein